MAAGEARKARPQLRFGKQVFFNEPSRVRHSADELVRLQSAYYRTQRTRSVVEAPTSLTNAYVDLVFAVGFARLGQAVRARQMVRRAFAALPRKDPIHTFLRLAFNARVQQALQGQLTDAPLPPSITERLNKLDPFQRYKVDRLRQRSLVLESYERLSPVRGFAKSMKDPRGNDVASLRGVVDQSRLIARVTRMMKAALDAKTASKQRVRAFDVIFDLLPRVPKPLAIELLRRFVSYRGPIPAVQRCELLGKALLLASYVRVTELVKQLLKQAKRALTKLPAGHDEVVGQLLRSCVRGAQRVGLTKMMSMVVAQANKAIRGKSTASTVARVQAAIGLAAAGQQSSIIELGLLRQADSRTRAIDRQSLTRALAEVAAHLPWNKRTRILTRLAQSLPQISDSFNTNSHFCLYVVQFMESLVLGFASEPLAASRYRSTTSSVAMQWATERIERNTFADSACRFDADKLVACHITLKPETFDQELLRAMSRWRRPTESKGDSYYAWKLEAGKVELVKLYGSAMLVFSSPNGAALR